MQTSPNIFEENQYQNDLSQNDAEFIYSISNNPNRQISFEELTHLFIDIYTIPDEIDDTDFIINKVREISVKFSILQLKKGNYCPPAFIDPISKEFTWDINNIHSFENQDAISKKEIIFEVINENGAISLPELGFWLRVLNDGEIVNADITDQISSLMGDSIQTVYSDYPTNSSRTKIMGYTLNENPSPREASEWPVVSRGWENIVLNNTHCFTTSSKFNPSYIALTSMAHVNDPSRSSELLGKSAVRNNALIYTGPLNESMRNTIQQILTNGYFLISDVKTESQIESAKTIQNILNNLFTYLESPVKLKDINPDRDTNQRLIGFWLDDFNSDFDKIMLNIVQNSEFTLNRATKNAQLFIHQHDGELTTNTPILIRRLMDQGPKWYFPNSPFKAELLFELMSNGFVSRLRNTQEIELIDNRISFISNKPLNSLDQSIRVTKEVSTIGIEGLGYVLDGPETTNLLKYTFIKSLETLEYLGAHTSTTFSNSTTVKYYPVNFAYAPNRAIINSKDYNYIVFETQENTHIQLMRSTKQVDFIKALISNKRHALHVNNINSFNNLRSQTDVWNKYFKVNNIPLKIVRVLGKDKEYSKVQIVNFDWGL